ncbi:MAG: DUF4870 domain-containing protein [Burkholderiales bacterium]
MRAVGQRSSGMCKDAKLAYSSRHKGETVMADEIKTSTGLNQNVAGMLCYLVGWITGLIFFLIEKDNKFVRFHAMQSIITFGGLTMLFMILGFIPFLGWMLFPILGIVQLVLWILLMVKAYQGEYFKLPAIGDLAEKNI